MNHLLHALAAAAALAVTAPAQSGDPGSKDKEWVRREVAAKQRAMREGSLIQTNVRVTVRLRNASRFRGVVKNGRFIERVDGLRFVPVAQHGDGAGLRLWYYDGTNSYIFLPYEEIVSYRIGERLSDAEVREIAARFAATGPKIGVPPAAKPVAGGPHGSGGELGSAEKLPELTAEEKALLAEFPPDQGWGPERLKQIEQKKVVLHVYPDEQERKFIESFDAWSKALERYEQRKAALARMQAQANRSAPAGAPPGTANPLGTLGGGNVPGAGGGLGVTPAGPPK